MRTEKQNKDLWNNDEDENEGCFSNITGSFVSISVALILVVLGTLAFGLLEKVVQFIFPIAIVAYVIGFLLNGFKK